MCGIQNDVGISDNTYTNKCLILDYVAYLIFNILICRYRTVCSHGVKWACGVFSFLDVHNLIYCVCVGKGVCIVCTSGVKELPVVSLLHTDTHTFNPNGSFAFFLLFADDLH